MNIRMVPWLACARGAALFLLLVHGLSAIDAARAAVVINEIHYHPVENAAFNPDGTPALDLSADVHEFIELYNDGALDVPLAGWRITGEFNYDFPTNAIIRAGQFLVVAKDPARLAAVAQYGLDISTLFGPYDGQLSNGGGTVRLRDSADNTVDSVSYSARFPWAIGADALGADDEWTGLRSADYQYRGRSLERVSTSGLANDPANWLASPAPGNPTPGRPNSVTRAQPRPVVIAMALYQDSNGATIIRANQAARVDCTFSGTNVLSAVSVEYFIDNINTTNEPRSSVSMSVAGQAAEGRFTALLPGQIDRTLIRYRIRANRGAGVETISPRPDDPFAWHSYFVTPARVSTNRIYDCFISSNSLVVLSNNISQTPERVTLPDPPGLPRAAWNATEPAVFVYNSEVFDIRMRHHASQYHRDPTLNSFKWQFPQYHVFEDRQGMFVTGKTEEWWFGAALFRAAGLPMSNTRWVDLYLNGTPVLVRMEQDEMDDHVAERWAEEQQLANPGTPREEAGEFYKAQGVFLWGDPTGPYGYGGFAPLPARPPFWTEQNRYEWTYGLQMHGWKGHVPLTQLLQGTWAARGDSPAAPNANIAALREFLSANFDVDEVLTYIALRSWDGVWDDFNHNWFLWRRASGRWGVLPWDFDGEAGRLSSSGITTQTNSSIYLGEFGVPTPYWSAFGIVKTCPTCACPGDSRGCWTDANWMKDSFYKAFRQEYKQKLFLLNNTLLNPANISAMGYANFRSYADGRFASINSQLGLGVFQRPARPANLSPIAGQAALPPAVLRASAYTHGSSPAPAHGSTTWFIRGTNGSYSTPVFKTTSTSNLTSLPIPFPALSFGQTYFWKCLYTDTNGHPSLESAETSFIYGTDTILLPGAIVLNEIMADNRSAVLHGAAYPDYVELFNNSPQAQNLNGLSLSDNTVQPGKYIFPPNTIISPSGHLVVWCDSDTNAPGLHTGFALDHEGQTVALFTITANGYALSDTLTFGLQTADFSIGRSPDGSGPWRLTVPTPSDNNATAPTASANALKINEWMATDAAGPDWFEIYNPQSAPVALGGFYLTDNFSNPTNSRIPDFSFIGARGFRQFIADQAPETSARHVNFKLSGSGEAIGLYDTNRLRIDGVTFGPQVAGVSQGRLPDGAGTIASFPNSASPEDPNYLPLQNILLNEVLSHSDPPLEDAVELYNPTAALVDLSGWWLSDDKNAPRKYRIPVGKIVPAGGFLVLYENEFNPTPASPTGFAFSSARGDAVYLSAADSAGEITGYRAGTQFDAAESGVSFGRFATSQGTVFVALAQRTFGADSPATVEEFRSGVGSINAQAKVGPVVISEVQYHPPNLPDGSDNVLEEFIELRNISGAPAQLFDPTTPTNTWRLRDAVDYVFPTNTTLAADEAVLVVSFDPVADTNALGAFLDAYGSVTAKLFGPYSGKLDNSSDSLELVKPGAPVNEPGLDFGYVPSILVDKVKYEDHFPWPQFADGGGASLMRLTLSAYGNDPTNWFAWYSTPGRSNITNVPPSVTVTQPSAGTVVRAPTNILLVAEAIDSDGTIASVDFFDGAQKLGRATGNNPYRFLWTNASFGLRQITARARDNGSATSASAAVPIRVLSTPPSIAITAPNNGAIFQLSNTVAITATASDIDTPVSNVEFFVDGIKIAEDLLPAFNATWTAVPGPHTISALATDSSGSVSTSAVVSIFVQNVVSMEVLPVAANSTWRYLDTGTNLGTSWTNLNFNDTAWASGPAELGYGDNDEATVISYGPSATAKYITYYFRQTFVLASPADGATVLLRVLRDDGAIAYLNGAEVYRDNMPAGAVNYLTTALSALDPPQEATFYPTNVTPSRLVVGTNVLAVEVHQASGQSSDVSFAADLKITRTTVSPAIVTQPQSRIVLVGTQVRFTASAVGSATLRYQWWRDGILLPGQTFQILTLASAQFTQAGDYTVTVTNVLGSVTSAPARLSVLAPDGDDDHDGLPNAWELTRGLNPLDASDAALDPDHDGMSNLAEYIAGTDPTNALSVLKIDSFAYRRAAVLSFEAISNATYTVQFTDELGHGPWQDLRIICAQSYNRVEQVGDVPPGKSRFYRLAVDQQPAAPLKIRLLNVPLAHTLSFTALSNKTYTVEYSDALGSGPWIPLTDILECPRNRIETAVDPTGVDRRYYRVVTPRRE
jgi:hypothetical protein